MLLLSLPVVIWNMLPDNKACYFVSFVTSGNLACTMLNPDKQVETQGAQKVASVKSSPPAPTLPWAFSVPTLAVIKRALEAGRAGEVGEAGERGLHIQTELKENEMISTGANDHIQRRDDVHNQDDDSQKKALEVLKVIRDLGYMVQKDPSHSRHASLPSVASNRTENTVTCQVCKKFTGRPCELKWAYDLSESCFPC